MQLNKSGYPVDNLMIMKTERLTPVFLAIVQDAGCKIVEAPVPGRSIVMFPIGWTCNAKEATARHIDGSLLFLDGRSS